jgi:hypothetical protein
VRVLLGQAVILAAAVVLVVGLHLFLSRTPQAVRRRVGDVGAEDEEREVDERRRQADGGEDLDPLWCWWSGCTCS